MPKNSHDIVIHRPDPVEWAKMCLSYRASEFKKGYMVDLPLVPTQEEFDALKKMLKDGF